MKKKVISSLIACSIIVTLIVGCNTKIEKISEEDNEKNEGISGEISFSTWGSEQEKEVNEQIIKSFEASHPNCKIKLEYIPDEYTTKIDTMFLAKEAPDVIYGHPKQLITWASQGLLMDLTKKFASTPELMDPKFNTTLYDAFKYDGKNIATVNGADTMLLFFNKDLFDEAGIAYPTESWNNNDLIAAAKLLTKKDANGKPTQYGISISNDSSVIETFMFANGGRIYDDMSKPTKAVVDSNENIEALQLIQDFIFKYGVAPTAEGKEILGGGFDTGKIAMDVTGVWACVYRSEIKDFKWDLVNVPINTANNGNIPAKYAGYGISNTSKNKELAWEFAKYMQSDEAQKLLASCGLITTINKQIATSDEVIRGEGAPEHHERRVTTLDNTENIDANIIDWDKTFDKSFTPALDQLLNNKITPKECAKMMQEGFAEALN